MSADFTPEKEDLKILTPFKMQVLTNFPYIEADFDALTNYQLLCKIVEYLNSVITETNEVTEQTLTLYNAYVALENYVNEYFDNTLPTLVDNKLDEMAEDGTLQNLLNEIMKYKGLLAFNTLNDLKESSNIENGSFAETLGYYSINDGGKATYKITNEESETEYQEDLGNGLYATLITNGYINVKQIGAYGDNTHDDSTAFTKAINYANTNHINIFIPIGEYLIENDLPKLYCGIEVIGEISSMKFENASIIHDTRSSGHFLFEITLLDGDQLRTGGGIKYLTIYYNGSNDETNCIFINNNAAGYFGIMEEVKIQGYATAIKSISNDYRYVNCQILLCGTVTNYAIYLTNGCNENKFSGCHIEHCRYVMKIDSSAFLNSFENGKIEMSKRNMTYEELSPPISITSAATHSAIEFNNTSFINLDISAYSNEEDNTFTYSSVPAMIYSTSLNIIITNCKFTCGLGSGSWIHTQNNQAKYISSSYGIISNNTFNNPSYMTPAITGNFSTVSNNTFIVETAGTYNCVHENTECIILNGQNNTEVANNYFLGKYAIPYGRFNNSYKINTDKKTFHKNYTTANGNYNTLVIKPTTTSGNDLCAMLMVNICSFYNKSRGYMFIDAVHIGSTNWINFKDYGMMYLENNYPIYASMKNGIIYIQMISDGNPINIDVKGLEGQQYTAYIDADITSLISDYDIQKSITAGQ